VNLLEFGLLSLLWLEAADQYELRGRILPECSASVSLYGATTPFSDSTLSDSRGRFHFRKLLPGAYTVAVFVPGRGEARQTIEVGPSLANPKGRVEITLELPDAKFERRDTLRRGATVSARELAVPERAVQEYQEAQKRLARRDVSGAVEHLESAVALAPRYAVAWNNLGTIAYQTRQYPKAEEYFRKALEADPDAFEPLVNLGGVLVTAAKTDEALKYNLYAVLKRPDDALANSQLGMSYFLLDRLDQALKYLTIARQIDPAHFSHPQLVLAEIHRRRGDRAAAAAELEDFLRRHPDSPDMAKIKAELVALRR
jgi:tetratricopeptide (TPR) repeat protein